MNGSVNLRRRINRQPVSFLSDFAPTFAGDRRMFPKNKEIAPQTSLEIQVLYENRQPPSDFPFGLQIPPLVERQNVFRHRPPNRQSVCKRSNISIHFPADL